MSNSLDPDLGANCLPRLSADDTGRQRVNYLISVIRPLQRLADAYIKLCLCLYPYQLIRDAKPMPATTIL